MRFSNERYTIDEFIVLGGFGAVHRTTNTKLGRIIAVKILKPDLKPDVKEETRQISKRNVNSKLKKLALIDFRRVKMKQSSKQ